MAATTNIEFIHSIDLVRAEEQVSIGEFTKMLYDRYEISTKFLIPVLILNTNQTWGPRGVDTWLHGIYSVCNLVNLHTKTILGTFMLYSYSSYAGNIYKGSIIAGVEEDFSDATIGDWYEYNGQKVV